MNNFSWPRKTLLYLAAAIFSLKLFAQQPHFVFDYITNNQGLSNNTVYDICQDSKGFTWFATAIGLNRFDGQNLKQYYHIPSDKHSLPASHIASMVYTSDSILFIATNKSLARYLPATDNFQQITLRSPMSSVNILAMRKGYKNELLIAEGKREIYIYNYVTDKVSKLDVGRPVFGMTTDRQNTYWFFSRYTLFRFDRNKKLMKTYRVSPNLFGSAISHIYSDTSGKLWVGTFENGLYTFNPEKDTFEQLPACKKTKMYYVRTLEEGSTPGEYWVGTESGLYIVNTISQEYRHYVQSFDHKRQTINDNAIYKIYRNHKLGTFFIGTFFGGVNIASKKHIGFNAILPEDAPGCLQGKAIGMIAKANDGKLWMATEDAGIAIFDKDEYKFRHLRFSEKDPNSISSNNVHALLMDGNTCWTGLFMGGICKINVQTGQAKRYLNRPGNPASLSNNFVFALHNLSANLMLVGTQAGVDLFDKEKGTFSRFRENEFTDSHIIDIFTAPDGKLWFCTNNSGIFVLDKSNKGLMTHFQMGDKSGLASNSIISYCIDSKKQVWIGTRNGGLLRYIANKQVFEAFNPRMLADNVIYGIVEDKNKYLWISTNKGISRLNPSNSTAIHFTNKHGLAGNQHNYKSYFMDKGIIYFGGVMGLTWFDPQSIHIPPEKPTVYFTNLRIFNEIIEPESETLEQQIDFTRQLNLKHNQNSFSFDFSTVNYFSNDIVYQYYLEGFDEGWSPWTSLNQVNYTNVAPGNYIFRVRVMNTINGLVSDERILNITVYPPFWASWQAYLLYTLLIGVIGYRSYRSYRNRQREKMALTIEKIEKENLKLLHQHKINFFTYISHEFKTPLSIIIASLEMLSHKENSEEKDVLQSIRRSSTRLLSLVNQLMEFRKIETDHATIHVTKGNIFDFSNQIITTYRPLLEKKKIKLGFKVQCAEAELYFDFDKLEKIMTNLLTNAIKYTPQNGTIDFELQVDNQKVVFSVKDSGAGISAKKKDKIFEVFYSDAFSNDIVESSGIGLALTAGLVKLLGGEIRVESAPGKGSKFIVYMPYFDNGPAPAEAATPHEEVARNHEIAPIDSLTSLSEPVMPKSKNGFRLVVAEDNTDLLMLLNRNFRKKYQVKCFENGLDAWEYIQQNVPDVLITDIMMPQMDGVELCQKVKTDVNLCHVPVIMLTAKDTQEAKLEGLQAGADAYIAKPFSMDELDVRLANILKSQKALKNRLKELAGIEGFDIPAANHEQAFVEKILAVIQSNMERSDLDVQFVADQMNISRSNLHNKMRSLMNMNTSEFINTVRINKAKELIVADELTLSEIAYKVGYKEAAYFFRMFKKHTGITPGEYRQNTKSEN